jgi:HEAT repeat protein
MADEEQADYRTLIDRLLDPDAEVQARAVRRLKRAGAAAVPELLEALSDPRFHVQHEGVHVAQPAPLEALLDLLKEPAPPEAVGPLARLLDHPSADVRKHAAMGLGELARLECVAALRQALRDPDPYVRSYAVMGIGRACERQHCPEAFRRTLYDDVRARLNDSEAEQAIMTLLQLDRARAVSLLLSERYLRADYEEVWNVFRAFRHYGLSIPAERLLAVLPGLEKKKTEIPYCWAYTSCLTALARAGYPEAFGLLDGAIAAGFRKRSLAGDLEEDASSYREAIAALAGLDDPRVLPRLRQLARSPRLELRTPAREALEEMGEAPPDLSPQETVRGYLLAEGFQGEVVLKEEKRFDESGLGGDIGVVFSFKDSASGEPHYAVTGLLVNYYPNWGLSPDEVYEQHLGLRDEPTPCNAEQRARYAERIDRLLRGNGLDPGDCDVLEVWKVPSPRQRRRKVLAALVRVPGQKRLLLLVGHDQPTVCAERTWRGQPLPGFFHLRRYLGRRLLGPPAPPPAEGEGTDSVALGVVVVLWALVCAGLGASGRRRVLPWEMLMVGGLVLVGFTLAGVWEHAHEGRRAWLRALRNGLIGAVCIPALCWLAINLLVWLHLDWVKGVRGGILGALLGGILGLLVGWTEQWLQRRRA